MIHSQMNTQGLLQVLIVHWRHCEQCCDAYDRSRYLIYINGVSCIIATFAMIEHQDLSFLVLSIAGLVMSIFFRHLRQRELRTSLNCLNVQHQIVRLHLDALPSKDHPDRGRLVNHITLAVETLNRAKLLLAAP